MGKVD